jgi:type I restriction enzyme, S subunit
VSLRLRHLAEMNPATPEIDQLAGDTEVTFMPLETVWAGTKLDTSRKRPKNEVSVGYTRFKNGDIITPKVTPTFQAGRSAIVSDLLRGVGCGSTELHVLRPRPDVDVRFLRYVVLSKPFLAEGVSAFQGVAGLQRVPDEFVRDFKVASFALEEQRRIADFLDAETARIDALDSLRSRQLESLSERAKTVVGELFAPSELNSSIRIKNLLAARPRYGVLVPEFVDEGVPFIRVNDLLELESRASELPQIPRSLSLQYSRTVVKVQDLLVSVVGTLGRVAVAPAGLTGANIARAVASLRPQSHVDVKLLCSWFRSSEFERQAVLATGGDTAQPTLGMEDLAGFQLRWPLNAVEQSRLAKSLLDIEASMAELKRRISLQRELLAERRQALITAAVTGQIDVTTARSGVSV